MSSTLETTKSTLWPQSPVPPATGTAWQWQVTDLRELSSLRADLRTLLRSVGCDVTTGDDPVSDRILLAVDELASNGLRHGAEPVQARLVATAEGWLIDVTDGATDQAPDPDIGRDATLGGLGLPLVAELTASRGWAIDAGRKHVWASLPRDTSAEAAPAWGVVDGSALQPSARPTPIPSGPGRWATITRALFSQDRALANARRAVERDLRVAAQREEAGRAFSGDR